MPLVQGSLGVRRRWESRAISRSSSFPPHPTGRTSGRHHPFRFESDCGVRMSNHVPEASLECLPKRRKASCSHRGSPKKPPPQMINTQVEGA